MLTCHFAHFKASPRSMEKFSSIFPRSKKKNQQLSNWHMGIFIWACCPSSRKAKCTMSSGTRVHLSPSVQFCQYDWLLCASEVDLGQSASKGHVPPLTALTKTLSGHNAVIVIDAIGCIHWGKSSKFGSKFEPYVHSSIHLSTACFPAWSGSCYPSCSGVPGGTEAPHGPTVVAEEKWSCFIWEVVLESAF